MLRIYYIFAMKFKHEVWIKLKNKHKMKTINIKIYTTNGEKILLDNVNWNKFKKQISKTNYDKSFTMKNGDLVTIINN